MLEILWNAEHTGYFVTYSVAHFFFTHYSRLGCGLNVHGLFSKKEKKKKSPWFRLWERPFPFHPSLVYCSLASELYFESCVLKSFHSRGPLFWRFWWIEPCLKSHSRDNILRVSSYSQTTRLPLSLWSSCWVLFILNNPWNARDLYGFTYF